MSDPVRLDKWLWAARFFKTRTLATDAVDGGKVRVNGERVKPARNVKEGDTLDIDNGSTRWEVVVRAMADKRGSAAIAQALYAETEASMTRREMLAEERRVFRDPGSTIKGRPTKRDRRLIDKSRE
ncbi:MAG TPA: RNA-binding S4 domain-containing protein [Noviherbaspirillum sp.]|nr:RNA-binding S4 domain-containing protein [Noviherbaspirillum sp.]